jgi:hypothetical protein
VEWSVADGISVGAEELKAQSLAGSRRELGSSMHETKTNKCQKTGGNKFLVRASDDDLVLKNRLEIFVGQIGRRLGLHSNHP